MYIRLNSILFQGIESQYHDSIPFQYSKLRVVTLENLFGIGFDMLFSELYKFMATEVTFVDDWGDRPNLPPGSAPVLDWMVHVFSTNFQKLCCRLNLIHFQLFA